MRVNFDLYPTAGPSDEFHQHPTQIKVICLPLLERSMSRLL